MHGFAAASRGARCQVRAWPTYIICFQVFLVGPELLPAGSGCRHVQDRESVRPTTAAQPHQCPHVARI